MRLNPLDMMMIYPLAHRSGKARGFLPLPRRNKGNPPLMSDKSAETRPWGAFRVLDEGPGYKVKRITVKPGGRLSLQTHDRRSEHWVVARGTARVTVGETVRDLKPDQGVYIALGQKHRLENPGDRDLELIEVQCGDYLGEDDIVRHEDIYNRR
jgi:mannose-6-phosphate isomerase-like protein (cupin superfamily)